MFSFKYGAIKVTVAKRYHKKTEWPFFNARVLHNEEIIYRHWGYNTDSYGRPMLTPKPTFDIVNTVLSDVIITNGWSRRNRELRQLCHATLMELYTQRFHRKHISPDMPTLRWLRNLGYFADTGEWIPNAFAVSGSTAHEAAQHEALTRIDMEISRLRASVAKAAQMSKRVELYTGINRLEAIRHYTANVYNV